MKKKEYLGFTKEQQWLLEQAESVLGAQYDVEAALVRDDAGDYDIHASAQYALVQLACGESDVACHILQNVVDAQFPTDNREEPFYGAFRKCRCDPQPAAESGFLEIFDARGRYRADVWQEKIWNDYRRGLAERGFSDGQIALAEQEWERALVKTVPVIWKTYDPNFREFIGCCFALALALFGAQLPQALQENILRAMERAVEGSVLRCQRNIHPMNTNIELMHIFTSDYFGALLDRQDFCRHSMEMAHRFEQAYEANHTVAEFNSPTYYCVDLRTLALCRRFAPDGVIRSFGERMEAALWENLAQFYNPELQNVCGPFSRNYAMDMRLDTTIGALLYILLGAERVAQPPIEENSEITGYVIAALAGTKAPEHLLPALCSHTGDRFVEAHFRELIERGEPGKNAPLCTAMAWIERDYMLGGLRGSKNTSGQLRAATAYWRAPGGSVSSMCMLRRAVGEGCEHYRTVFLDAQVQQGELRARVRFDVTRDMELFFELNGEGIVPEQITAEQWNLPGMRVEVQAGAPLYAVCPFAGGVQVCYRYNSRTGEGQTMDFKLRFEHIKQCLE